MHDKTRPFDWDELLDLIEARRVIPIIGKALLTVTVDGEQTTLERHLAQQLAAALGVGEGELPSDYGLNEVAVRYLDAGNPSRRVYTKLKSITEDLQSAIPAPLIQLAEITDFMLYVTTTFDSLLLEAVNQTRCGAQPCAKRLVYSPDQQLQDIPAELPQLTTPHVFHLLGIADVALKYAVTEEDVLEFIYSLQSETRRPPLLFDEFRHCHLLFLGCGFPDWLTRFCLRTVANERLLPPRETSDFFADSQIEHDHSLASFLKYCRAEIYVPGDPIQFVSALYSAWKARNPPSDNAGPNPTGIEEDAIFISYASEDLVPVRVIEQALKDAGLDTWFDKREFRPGDAWDSEIRANIRKCSLFFPIISRNAQQRLEGYFRREWRWAIDRAEGIAESVPFIIPILIDDTPEGAEDIPSYFWTRQGWRVPAGRVPIDFVEHIKSHVRNLRLRKAGLR